jgi:hypothetical protein
VLNIIIVNKGSCLKILNKYKSAFSLSQ